MYDAAAYATQLQQLLPPGAAWPRDPDAMLTRLLGAVAIEYARVDVRAAQLLEEADPRTALELLTNWERVCGLPDTCSGQIPATVPERRAAIVSKLTARGGQSIVYLTQLAADLGFAIAVEEFTPLRAGFRAGDRCQSVDWAFAFRVDVLPQGSLAKGADPIGGASPLASIPLAETLFRAGSRAGERLRSFGTASIECVIRRVKPAHATVIFAYPPADVPAFLYDFTQEP